MLTPVDIENKEFTKTFRGYEIYEVEEFMKGLVADYEKLYRDNAELKEKNALLNEAIGNYKGMEETMQNAILVAQRTAEDTKKNAYERAETIIKDAERRAAEAISKANQSIANLEKTYLGVQSEMNGFKAKMSALLSTYIQLLSEMPEKASTKTFESLTAQEPVVEAKDEIDQQNTNTFVFPSSNEEKEEETPGCVPEPLPTNTGFEAERKPNPLVEELLQKRKEQNTEDFSVVKQTVQIEESESVSAINLEDLKDFDVFKDDSI